MKDLSEAPKKRGRKPKTQTTMEGAMNAASDRLEKTIDLPMRAVHIMADASAQIQRNPSVTIPEQIAGNSTAFFNWKWPGAEKDFPAEPWLRTVKHYYPFPSNGEKPLLADFPQLKNEFEACSRKAKILKGRGFRYIVVVPGMSMQEAMEALK
jgi:hypothetical protein